MVNKYLTVFVLVINFYIIFTNGTPRILLKMMANRNRPQRWCGIIPEVLEIECTKYPEPEKRMYTDPDLQALTDTEEIAKDLAKPQYSFILELGDNRLLDVKYKRGIYNECCANKCTLNYIGETYCENL